MEMSSQFHSPAALPRVKSPFYSLDRKFGGPQNRSGRGEKEKSHNFPCRELNPGRPASTLLATLNDLLQGIIAKRWVNEAVEVKELDLFQEMSCTRLKSVAWHC
jgi:hypothetical protein